MLKRKISHKVSAIAMMLSALLFLGAGCQDQTQKENIQVPVKSPSESPVAQIPFEPLKLNYELKNFGPTGPNGKLGISIWLEGKQQCSGREAYVGIVKMDSDGQKFSQPNSLQENYSQWSKITIFADNGVIAVSRPENEDKLAFDDMKSEYDQMNISLTLNSIFAYAGKNFNSPDVWSSTTPILLKNVDSGMSLTDYSVIRQEEQTTGVLPCQKFKIVAKGTNMEGVINSCVAKEINNVKLPFIVSMAFGEPGQNGPSWQLVSYSKEKSGIAFVPQCMEPVKCTYIKEPAQTEKIACSAKSGQFEQQRTEQGCVTEYKCMTQEEIITENLLRMQRPGCEANQAVVKKLIGCRKNSQPNFDVTAYGDDGCATSVACRP
jgi:hypothetical protein